MKEQKASFYSDGLKLDGAFFLPDNEKDLNSLRPVVIVCSGFLGLKNIHPERFARALVPKGYIVFGFDYRGFSQSEGEKEHIILEDQIRDIVNAVHFVETQKVTSGRKTFLAGWGMAGGLILEAAKLAYDLDGLISINGFFNSERVQKTVRGEKSYQEFVSWLKEERKKLVQDGNTAKYDSFHAYPLDPVTREYVEGVLEKNPDFGSKVKISFIDSLLSFHPEQNLAHLNQTPILIAHGDNNQLHPTQEAQSLYKSYPGPKDLYWIPEAGHTEWMLDENSTFQGLVSKIDQWLMDQWLIKKAS